jgi:hypothetical protein
MEILSSVRAGSRPTLFLKEFWAKVATEIPSQADARHGSIDGNPKNSITDPARRW